MLLNRVPDGIDPMLTCLETHIYQVQTQLLDQTERVDYSFPPKAGIADMVASAEVITADSEKYVEQLLELFRRFSLLVSQVKLDCWLESRRKLKLSGLP